LGLAQTLQALEYHTPEGFADAPFISVYNTDALADGGTYQYLSSITDGGSNFKLRRVSGLNTVLNPNLTGQFLLRNKDFGQLSQAPIAPGLDFGATRAAGTPVTSGIWPMFPEGDYPASTAINFDLFGTLRNFTADTPNIYNSQIAFCGIRRYSRDKYRPYTSPFKFYELPYTYVHPINLNWAHWTDNVNGLATLPRKFGIQVLENDFQLCAIGATYADGTKIVSNDLRLTLYDVSGFQALSNSPVNLAYYNYNGPAQYGKPVLAPGMVWPMGGRIVFDIQSMLPFGTTKNIALHFMGMRRRRID
jgi:hypothetical protein